jgi:hypothetical protein
VPPLPLSMGVIRRRPSCDTSLVRIDVPATQPFLTNLLLLFQNGLHEVSEGADRLTLCTDRVHRVGRWVGSPEFDRVFGTSTLGQTEYHFGDLEHTFVFVILAILLQAPRGPTLLSHTMMRSLAFSTVLFSVFRAAGAVHVESNRLVHFEVEDSPISSDWVFGATDSITGFDGSAASGTGFYQWSGANIVDRPGSG